MGEFKGITGPGKYRRRNETMATITERNPDRTIPAIYRWKDEHGRTYRDEGNFYVGSLDLRDIVAGPLTDQAELAGLTGYVAVSTDGDATHGDLEIQPAMSAAIYGGGIIDLSTIRKYQLVPPEPKRIEIWKSAYRREDGSIYVGMFDYASQAEAQAVRSGDDLKIATLCIFNGLEGEGVS